MFSKWKSEDKNVLNQVVCRALDLKVTEKEVSDDFCGVYVDTRPRAVGLVEEFAALKSFKLFSKYNYPLFVFLNENYSREFLNEKLIKDWRITVIPIRNLDCSKNLIEYSDFMVRELPFLIPEQFKKSIFLQADGFLLNFGYEELIEHYYPYFLGAPTRHLGSVIFPDRPDLSNKEIVNLNGGFSFRRLDKMRELSKKYSHLACYERGRADFAPPPEDQFFNYTLALEGVQSNLEAASIFSQDPLRNFEDIKFTYGFHSCQT